MRKESRKGCSASPKPTGPIRLKKGEKESMKPVKTSAEKKKVRFSECNDVFQIPDHEKQSGNKFDMVIGKRFTAEEDQIIKDAVSEYMKEQGLGADDAHMLFETRQYPQVRTWLNNVYPYIPWRRRNSVYLRACTLLIQCNKGNWTPEEIKLIKSYRKEHGKGSRWQDLSAQLGRNRIHIKDVWRRNRLPDAKKGHWSQEEYQQLFDLVNVDLRMKAFDREKVQNAMLKENISWMAISDKLATRNHVACCMKWYDQLASPMVAKGLWVDADDYSLVNALLELDASCIEDVDWDNLVENRSADVCKCRWKEMTKHIGEKRERSFSEQVEILSKRYCADMVEYRMKGAETL